MIGILTWFAETDDGETVVDYSEEAVRCRDCTAYFVDEKQVARCATPCGDSLHGTAACDPDGFCKWGERR